MFNLNNKEIPYKIYNVHSIIEVIYNNKIHITIKIINNYKIQEKINTNNTIHIM